MSKVSKTSKVSKVSLDKRISKNIYKNIGEYEITCLVDKVNLIKQLNLQSTFETAMNFELYKHKNNIYVLNQTTLLHYNLKSKQLKEKISDSDSIKLYKLIGYFLNLNIKEEIKTNKKLSTVNKIHTKTLNSLKVGEIYYHSYLSGYGFPVLHGYKIIKKLNSSIIVSPCIFQKKIGPKTIKYELVGIENSTINVKIYKNQDFQIQGYPVEVLKSNANIIRF